MVLHGIVASVRWLSTLVVLRASFVQWRASVPRYWVLLGLLPLQSGGWRGYRDMTCQYFRFAAGLGINQRPTLHTAGCSNTRSVWRWAAPRLVVFQFDEGAGLIGMGLSWSFEYRIAILPLPLPLPSI